MIELVREMTRRHEGYRRKPYRCLGMKMTIGIGHNFQDNPLPAHIRNYLLEHGEITDEMVMELFEGDIQAAISDCKKLYPKFDSFSKRRRAALVDFLFNLGFKRASAFRNTNLAINDGRWEDAAEGIRNSLYYRQLGGDPKGTDDGRLERPEEIAQMIMEG